MTNFTDEERDRVRVELLEAGHDLFAKHGFDRTRISDVTDAVGIGTSTFYQFFDSKEELYHAVLIDERDRLFETLESAVADAETPHQEAETILRTTLTEVQSNPLIRRLFVDGKIRIIEDQLDEVTDEGDQESHCSESLSTYDRILSQPEEWVDRGIVRIDDPDIVRGLFRSILFVTQARETPVIPDGSYEPIEDALIETIVAGLFETEH
ncbi:TetR/AcrR family transcriptional regulator [Halorubrum halodurans]|uniref:Transcriptional regulator n=1 Tax=Halorubrum halodurans TaxID=1383851 RepID=A0A256IBX0_9EURY|nr:TetR/AcrR family transcriptional regulator [Halorubrum halodurans]OYR53991.1 transcriptional regulator [Halorubrum halodurans]